MSFPCVRLEEVCDFLSGFAWSAGEFESEPTGLPIIRIQNVDAVRESDFVYWGGAYDERFVIRSGDILLTLSGSFRAEVWPGPDALLNQRIVKLTPKGAISPDWLLYVVRHKLAEIAGMGRHALVSNVALADLRALSVPLPPLPEQRRIAAILDKADALRTKRREALAQLDRLAQSIFVEMFGDPATNPRGWPSKALGDITTKMGSGSTPTGGDAAYKESGISLIRSMNVHDGCFVHKNLAHIDDEQAAKLKNVVVEADDVLLNITGASVARVCRAPSDVLPARVNQHVMIIRPSDELSSIFLERLLLSPSMRTHLLKVGGAGATREAITKADAEELSVIVPPKALQVEFERRSRQALKLQELHETELARLDGLFASLQHRAFRGEL